MSTLTNPAAELRTEKFTAIYADWAREKAEGCIAAFGSSFVAVGITVVMNKADKDGFSDWTATLIYRKATAAEAEAIKSGQPVKAEINEGSEAEAVVIERAKALAAEYNAAGLKRAEVPTSKFYNVLKAEFPGLPNWLATNIAVGARNEVHSNRKPFSQFAGYVASLKSAGAGNAKGWTVIYEAGPAKLDTTAGKFIVVCERHGQTSYNASLKQSRPEMKEPATFCIYCRHEVGEGPKPADYDGVVAEHKQIAAERGF